MVGVPFTISIVQAASVWTRVAGLPAFSRPAERAMLRQAACAAAISSSGFVPGFPSKRVAKLYGPLKAPLPALKVPFPSLSFPSHTALALLVGIGHSRLVRSPGNLAGPAGPRYAFGTKEDRWPRRGEPGAPRHGAPPGGPNAASPSPCACAACRSR